jgi:hypothetical protein
MGLVGGMLGKLTVLKVTRFLVTTFEEARLVEGAAGFA